MFENLIQLVVLFVVIIDPMASFAVFTVATDPMKEPERRKTALLAILVAAVLSGLVLFLGERLLHIFNTDLQDFKVAGGIILLIFGIQMSLGMSLFKVEEKEGSSSAAIASLIATPLLTGPATISAIIIAAHDFGVADTGLAITIVLAFSAVLLLLSARISKKVGKMPIQVMSTIMGLITLAWGVMFIRDGLGF
ncbi:MAG: MarC family protein [Thermoplasmata archaeon]